jgi:predicted alternative tryptophan synthase beta-subunit
MASPTFYNNYTQLYLASVLAHELIHATHIANEAITYNMCELIEDDYRNTVVFNGWDAETQTAVAAAGFSGMLSNLNDIKYGQAYIPQEVHATAGLGFHSLDGDNSGTNSVVQHGYDENRAYPQWSYDPVLGWRTYDSYHSGNTPQAILAELKNFSAYT